MKRLTKDERTGATAIALVALLICGGSMLLKRMERRVHASPEVVKTIILASDSLENKNEREPPCDKSERKGKKKSKRRERTEKSKRKGKDSKQGSKNRGKDSGSPRDFLSDPL